MPIYEYKCEQCGLHFETRQSVSDEPLTTCEKCHGRLEKQWSLSGFQFKGAGWYVTDYAGKNTGKSKQGEQTGEASNASKTDEAKAATPKETAAAKPSAE